MSSRSVCLLSAAGFRWGRTPKYALPLIGVLLGFTACTGGSLDDDDGLVDDVDDDTGSQDAGPVVPVSPTPTGSMEPMPFQCDPPNAATECELCMQVRCCDERAACADDSVCAAEWAEFLQCVEEQDFANNPPAAPLAEIDACAMSAAPDNNPVALSDEFFALTACVGMEAMEDIEDEAGATFAGDGICTEPCYGLFTLTPVEEP